jgi:hypothetical protein
VIVEVVQLTGRYPILLVYCGADSAKRISLKNL